MMDDTIKAAMLIAALLGGTNAATYLGIAKPAKAQEEQQIAMYSNCAEELKACWAEVRECKAGR